MNPEDELDVLEGDDDPEEEARVMGDDDLEPTDEELEALRAQFPWYRIPEAL